MQHDSEHFRAVHILTTILKGLARVSVRNREFSRTEPVLNSLQGCTALVDNLHFLHVPLHRGDTYFSIGIYAMDLIVLS